MHWFVGHYRQCIGARNSGPEDPKLVDFGSKLGRVRVFGPPYPTTFDYRPTMLLGPTNQCIANELSGFDALVCGPLTPVHRSPKIWPGRPQVGRFWIEVGSSLGLRTPIPHDFRLSTHHALRAHKPVHRNHSARLRCTGLWATTASASEPENQAWETPSWSILDRSWVSGCPGTSP